MIGERNHGLSPTAIQVPPWRHNDDPPSTYPIGGVTPAGAASPNGCGADLSPFLVGDAALKAFRRFLPSNDAYASDDAENGEFSDSPVDAYSCDEFRMYEFKVRRCARGRSHDWTECPYAHPGEKARRRDPRKYHYSGTACPDFRKGTCKKGDTCEFAHGVFECWLHPARYRTQPCKDGVNCRRRVCFFAHTPEQLRVLPTQQSPRNTGGIDSYDGSPMRKQHHQLQIILSSSPTSTMISPPTSSPSGSPPLSPSGGAGVRRGAAVPGGSSVNELLASLRQLQLINRTAKSPWGIGSLRMGMGGNDFNGVTTTPSRMGAIGGGGGLLDGWEEPLERVESGRDLRAMMAEKLRKENGLGRSDDGGGAVPDLDWVSDLVK